MTIERAPHVVLSGRFVAADERRYAHIPFTVPTGVRQLHLRCDYSDRIGSDPMLEGGNTLDLGLFDARGIAPGSLGFRGWSGSERTAITIDERWATPPYRPGPVQPGEWHLLLGPYKVGPRGLDWRAEIWFDPDLPPEPPSPAIAPPERVTPPAAEPGWLRGELHCHTQRSDGDATPAEIARAAQAAGLDFIAITDHNSPPGFASPPEGPIVIPGIEITTYGGHWNAWGTDGWYEFRTADAASVAAAMTEATAAGAFVSVNHPKPFGPDWIWGDDLGYAAIEVWNGPWERLNGMALARWEAHLRRGERVVAVGGSDTHRLRVPRDRPLAEPTLGQPTIWVQAPQAPAEILAAIRRGNAFLSASPAGPQLYLDANGDALRLRVAGAPGAALLLIGDSGCLAAVAVDAEDFSRTLPFPAATTYVRAQLVDAAGNVLALSNPRWRDDLRP
jgi:predicted metal-dependent phosphoesterase TrpH